MGTIIAPVRLNTSVRYRCEADEPTDRWPWRVAVPLILLLSALAWGLIIALVRCLLG